MFYRVMAPKGAGKRAYLLNKLKKAVAQKQKAYVIVPEQISAFYERQVVSFCGAESNDYVEVTNFSRLSNVVLRHYGSLARKSMNESEKKLLLSECIANLPLKTLPNRTDPDSVTELYTEWEEFRQAGLTAASLSRLSEMPFHTPGLGEKLGELALISASFATAAEGRFDDPSEEGERLANILAEFPFFRDSLVILDGFWDFTVPQEKIIRRMLIQAKDVYISFPAEKKEVVLFSKILRSARRLLSAARELSVAVEDIQIPVAQDSSPRGFLCRHLVNGSAVYPEQPQGIRLVRCDNTTEEARWAASECLRLAREGVRWNQMAVLSRDGADAEILALTLEEKGIPYFSEERICLARTPLAKTLLLACDMILGKGREDVVRNYVKNAVCRVPVAERFLLENYLYTWGIYGKQFLGAPFTMHPDGYFTPDEKSRESLVRINEVKETMAEPLRRLRMALVAGKNEEKIAALVAFLGDIGSEEVLFQQVEEAKKQDDYEKAAFLVQNWNCLLEGLSSLGRALGDRESDGARFLSLLQLALDMPLPGAVPPGQDRVQIGRVNFSRPENAECILITGLNAGVFPAGEKKGGVFPRREREELRALGYPFPDSDESLSDEYFYFYLAAAYAKKELLFSYSAASSELAKGSLSIFGKRLHSLFPQLKEEYYSSKECLPDTQEEAFSYYVRLEEDHPNREILENYFFDKEEYRRRALDFAAGRGFHNQAFFLREKKPYEGQDVNMVYSRLEKYSLCRFSYYSRYLLEAKSRDKATLGANIAGSFVHRVLELALSHTASEKKDFAALSNTDLEKLNEEAVKIGIAELLGEEILTGSLAYLAQSLARTTLLILKNLQKEFSLSGFRPLFFEKSLSDLSGAYEIPLKDGKKLCLFGEIDRVDLYDSPSGQSYVRVVDYKTGGHDFSLEDVANGLDLQMLLYLFALWNSGFEYEGKTYRPFPAGILYLNGMDTPSLCENGEQLKSLEDTPYAALSRRGLVVDVPELLSAQDPEGLGEFIPVAWNKKKVSGAANLISMENLGKLRKKVERDFASLAEELKEGRIEAVPLYSKGKKIDPCRYCEYLPLCKRNPDNRRLYRSHISKEELFGEEEA